MRLALSALLIVAIASMTGFALSGPASVSAGIAAPDLTVSGMLIELETGGSCAFTSTQLGVRVTVANNGAADAGPFVVEVNGDQQTVSQGLAAGDTLSLWFAGYQSGQNTAIVDATNQVAETDEGNNQLSQVLPVPTLPAPCTSTPTSTPLLESTPTATAVAATLPGTGIEDAAGASTPAWLISALLAGVAVALIGLAAVRLRRA